MRKAITSLDELDKTCSLDWGGVPWKFNKHNPTCSNGYHFERMAGSGYVAWLQREEVEAFIRWGAITKEVKPRTFEGATCTMSSRRIVVVPSDWPEGIRVLVTEVLSDPVEVV